jgi:hypothetical protein
MDMIGKIVLTLAVLCLVVFVACNVYADPYDAYCCLGSRSVTESPSGVITIQPPVGLPSHAYTSPNGTITIQPPTGPPTFVYPGAMPSSPVTVQPPVGLPSYIYGR